MVDVTLKRNPKKPEIMKKIFLSAAFASLIFTFNAQDPWSTNLNYGSSASNPFKLGTGDPNDLSFFTDGVENMTLTKEGSLKLNSLSGSASDFVYVDEHGNLMRLALPYTQTECFNISPPWIQGGNNTALNVIGTCNNVDFILKAYNNKSVFLKTDGRLGLGLNNSAPSAPLDFFDGINPNNTDHLLFYPDKDGVMEATNNMNLNYNGTGTGGFYINEGSNGTATTKLSIVGQNMLVDASGQFNGWISSGGDIYGNGVIQSSNIYSYAPAFMAHNNTTNTNNFLVYNSGKTIMGSQTGASNSAWLNINVAGASVPTNALDIYDQYTNKVNYRVKSNGEVYARYVKVTQNAFPDYVFANDYKLPNLKDVESYYKKNKHLEGIPSAAEVEKDGLELGEISTTLVKKIEELTIYTVEQNKKIEYQQELLTKLQEQIKEFKKVK